MTNLSDLEDLIKIMKDRDQDASYRRKIEEAIYTILADYETRIAALEAA